MWLGYFFFSQVYSHKKSHQLTAREDHLPWQPALRDCQFWHRKLWGARDETLASWTRTYCVHKTKASGPVCSGFHGAHPALVRKRENLLLVLSTTSRLGNTISLGGRRRVPHWLAKLLLGTHQPWIILYLRDGRGNVSTNPSFSAADHLVCTMLNRCWLFASAL